MKKNLLIILFYFATFQINAQIYFNININADSTFRNVLQGTGIYNLSFTSMESQPGSWGIFYSNANTGLGFNNGIVMTTGVVNGISQPPSSMLSANNGGTQSTWIENEYGFTPNYDQSTFQIGVIPIFDTIAITYVFASEEYPEYVGTGYSDAFGIFISGPNPQGGSYNNYNFALIPDTITSINVNTVNNGSTNNGPCYNCQYYIPGINFIAYDGLTTEITSKIAVVPNQYYNIVFSIADVTDRYYDSGLFLKAYSLKSICDTTYYTENYVTICQGDVYNFNGHLYDYPGTYYDTLVTSLGCDSIIATHLNIQYVQCYFSTVAQQGNQITLSNQTNGVNYSFIWDFGDGTYAHQNNLDTISHTYTNGGFYNICLGVIDTISLCFRKQCFNTSINTTPDNCDAQFYYDISGDSVYFHSTYSQGQITDYYWIFETGEISHEADPIIVFPTSGYFSVKLIVFNSETGCFSEKEQMVYYSDYMQDCKSDFDYFPIANENRVVFNNLSLGSNIDYYIWDFGDGTYSNLKNPTHYFMSSGMHDVCLSISNTNCVHTKCKRVISGNPNSTCRAHITAFPPSEIINPEDIPVNLIGSIFSNQETSAFSLLWNFGDSTIIENQMSIIHSYTDLSIYLVQFNISSSSCQDDVFEIINLTSDNQLKVLFGAIPITDGLKDESKKPIKFKGVTMGEPSLFNWDFGDGETDTTSMFPTHEFSPNVVYNVCLTVSNIKTNQTDEYCKNIIIIDSTSKVVEITDDIKFNCYPIPSIELINIDYTLINESLISINLYDSKGIKQDIIFEGYVSGGSHSTKLLIKDYPSGVYFIQLSTNKTMVICKVIKE